MEKLCGNLRAFSLRIAYWSPQITPGPGAYEPCWKLGDPLNTETIDPSFSLFFRNPL